MHSGNSRVRVSLNRQAARKAARKAPKLSLKVVAPYGAEQVRPSLSCFPVYPLDLEHPRVIINRQNNEGCGSLGASRVLDPLEVKRRIIALMATHRTHVAAFALSTVMLRTSRSHGTVDTRSTINHPYQPARVADINRTKRKVWRQLSLVLVLFTRCFIKSAGTLLMKA